MYVVTHRIGLMVSHDISYWTIMISSSYYIVKVLNLESKGLNKVGLVGFWIKNELN